MRKTILLPILTIVLSSAILLGLYNGLAGIRKINIESELQTKMETLLPGSTSFQQEGYNGEDSNIRTVYRGETGYVVGVSVSGYVDQISMLVGVSDKGNVTGLQVRNMEETYGLGREALTDWEFLAQFLNTKGDAEIGTGMDALTGATVTSRAIARGVNSAVGFVTGADVSSGATSWGG
ncbi:MAG: FMN-binding protein [Oscillospiraceae bacterium]|nr:FMN-binding protein [Oscillospiraceae bacterium]